MANQVTWAGITYNVNDDGTYTLATLADSGSSAASDSSSSGTYGQSWTDFINGTTSNTTSGTSTTGTSNTSSTSGTKTSTEGVPYVIINGVGYNTNTGAPYVDPGSTDPNAEAAALINAQFAQWQSMFEPIEISAMQQNSMVNPKVLTDALSKAKTGAEEYSDQMAGIVSREDAAMGISPTDQQTATINRVLNIDKSLNVAGAENQARTTQRTLNEEVLTGTVSNPNVVSNKNNSSQLLTT